jgi:mannan endo-1,4-beta-mannosidase
LVLLLLQGLDFVVAEARRHGIYLLLCLANNFHDFGGKRQYVQWARDAGHRLATDDDFFNSTVVKGYYKNHVKVLVCSVSIPHPEPEATKRHAPGLNSFRVLFCRRC